MNKKILGATVAALLGAASQSSLASSENAFVHLFEWKWDDIAIECEQHLGPKGFKAVQVSPPQKSINNPNWWARYQPVSYAIEGRSGNREQFRSMVQRCANVGVDIYVDAVINHMAAWDRNFPEVPYSRQDFHNCTDDIDYGNRWQVQNCDLVGLNDLATESDYVRGKIADYMNDMTSLGVKGFRIDAAKHIPSGDIAAIKGRLHGNPYIFQEVIGAWGEPVQPGEYVGNGDVTEFNFERTLADKFRNGRLNELRSIGNGWLNSNDAVVFVSNHDDQRQHRDHTLTYKDAPGVYYIAEIFSLAYPYGYPKVMSSYKFGEGNDDMPPGSGPHTGDSCDIGGAGGSWVCEHRWHGIANMPAFRKATGGQKRVTDWWDNGGDQIAFGRGGLGFVAINGGNGQLNRTLQTGMPEGEYCDVIQGDFVDGDCTGPTIQVNSNGSASFSVSAKDASAIHVNAKVGDVPPPCGDNCPPPDATWDDAYFRGTPNSWGTTAMTYTDGLWRTTQTFGSDNPRFKISRYTDWSEAYPDQDYPITQGAGTYTITFNDSTKEINVTRGTVTPPPPPPVGDDVDVTFTCRNGNTSMGQSVYVIGDIDELGNWNTANAVKLDADAYPTWSGTISLPANQSVEWKCLKRDENDPDSRVEWQSGSNNQVNTGSGASTSGSF